MPKALDWARDGRDWPNRSASSFVTAAGLRWHVQRMGNGPDLLLLHGTGAATHSWRDLAPLLAQHFTLVAPDLPGHGFTGTPSVRQLGLPGMVEAVSALLHTIGVAPRLAVGHSAGAAILARMCLDGRMAPAGMVGLNGAYLPLATLPAQLFSPLAKLLARVPLIPQAFAWHAADRAVVERLLDSTGSRLEADGIRLYARLMRNPGHAAGALGMMANWDLEPLRRDLPRLKIPLLLIAGGSDRSIPPSDAARVARLVPGASLVRMPGLGHLAHEENPGKVADLIGEFSDRLNIARAA